MGDVTREQVKAWIKERDELEAEMKALIEVLEAPNGGGIKGKLVDEQDFPRADVDVHGTLAQRNRLSRLQTDHKELMEKIESGMMAVMGAPPKPGSSSAKRSSSVSSTSSDAALRALSKKKAFARIDKVDSSSPAYKAGLKNGDEIVKFGSVTGDGVTTAEALKAVAQVVAANENKQVKLYVKRSSSVVKVSMTPRKWSGRGLLGCHLIPL